MTYDPHDPRLTAYALGELDEAERPEVEAQIDACAESRKAVEEIRALARLLTEQLHKEPSPGLAAAHRQTIEGRLAVPVPASAPAPTPSRRPMILRLTYVATAASALTAAGLGLRALRPAARAPLVERARANRTQIAAERAGLEKFAPAHPPILAGARPPSVSTQLHRDSTFKDQVLYSADTNSMYASASTGPGLGRQAARGERMIQYGAMMSGQPPRAGSSLARRAGAAYYRSVDELAGAASAPTPPPETTSLASNAPASPATPTASSVLGDGARDAAKAAIPSSPQAPATMPASEPELTRAEQPPPDLTLAFHESERLVEAAKQAKAPAPLSGPQAQAGEAKGQPKAGQDQNGVRYPSVAMDFAAKARDTRNVGQSSMQPDQQAQLAQQFSAPLQGETYQKLLDNLFVKTTEKPRSTFAIDVDTASYANVRRFLRQGQIPPVDAVRIEEMINYFSYDDPPPPQGDEPFSVRVEIAGCPWTPQHRLARVALKSKEIDQAHRPPSNLVFLLDVSGSMADDNKLPLLKAAMRLLVDTLGENDRVAIVVYAGRSGLALPSTNGLQKAKILEAIDQLAAGGSTNGGAGIQLAYEQAVGHFIPGGTNRVILATDGDFNVGVTDESALIRMAEQKAKSGVFLSVLGFGEGNLKERTMEQMADKGNGNYYYIDSLDEARKVLVEQAGGTLVTIAKDVKIQVEFQPEQVARYRLIGYENRLMREEDFRDDTKDAGEIGAGHNVTALYELVPAQPNRLLFAGRAIREAKEKVAARAPVRRPSFTVFLRYKPPQGDTAKEIQRVAVDDGRPFPQASPDFQFAAAVAAFGMLLRDAPDKGRLTYDGVYELAAGSRGSDPSGYRSEFLDLVRRAKAITRAP